MYTHRDHVLQRQHGSVDAEQQSSRKWMNIFTKSDKHVALQAVN